MTVGLSLLGGAAQQFFDNNGVILSGGKIYIYAAGTTTFAPSYTDYTGNVAHSNPIILDSAGRVPGGEIWLVDGDKYKFVIYTANDVLLNSYDYISTSQSVNIANATEYTSFSEALVSAPATWPILTGYGGMYLPGWSAVDPGHLLTTAMLPSLADGRAPFFIMNNPSASQLVDGYASGLYIHIGDSPSATPAAGDTVAITTAVNNLNGRTHLWGSNTVALQDSSGLDGMVRAAEFEVNNVKGFNADPFSGSAPYRKNGVEIVGHSSSTYKLTAALTVWANNITGTGWFDQGLVLSRVASKGIRFIKNPGGSSDSGVAFSVSAISDESDSAATISVSGSHGSVIDLSGNPTYSQFILGKGNADTVVNIKNSADYAAGVVIDSGASSAQNSFLDFSDQNSVKWRITKNNANDLFIVSDPLGTPSNAIRFQSGGSTLFEGSVGFHGSAPIAKPTVNGSKGGNAALTSLIAALASYGLIQDSTT